jgi:hypothetical protein
VRREIPPLLLLLAYGLLQVAVIYHPVRAPHARAAEILLFLAMAVSVAAVALFGRRPPSRPVPEPRWDLPLLVLLLVLDVGLVAQIHYGVDIGDRAPPVQRFAAVAMVATLVLTVPTLLHVFPPWPWTLRAGRRLSTRGLFWFLVGAGCAVKVLGILLEPRPGIDVWYVLQNGAQNLANGQNPFGTQVPEIARMAAAFGNPPVFYVYPPSTLLLSFPFVMWLGDVRYLYVVADLAAVVLLLCLAREGSRGPRLQRYAEIAGLLLVFHPRSFAKAWTDPVAIPLFLLFVLLARRQRSAWAAAAAGFFLSMKQYLVYLLPLLVAQLRRGRSLLLLGVTAVATSVPFLIWSADDLYRSAVAFHFQTPFREDGLTVASFLHHTAQVRMPGWLGTVVGGAVMLAGAWLSRDRGLPALAAWGGLGYLFLFGLSAYAFPNYYHLVMGLFLVGGILVLEENLPGPRPGASAEGPSAAP